MRAFRQLICFFSFLLGLIAPLSAQRPTLFTESPITSADGNLNVGAGFEYLKKNKVVPSRTPLSLWKIPVFRSYLGLGDIIDVIVDWRGRLLAKQETGRHVSDWGDLTLGTKITLLRESKSRPAVGFMYLVKLPNTSHDELLGSNQTDFFLSALGAKQIGDLHLRANLGVGILDHPEEPHTQLDIYTTSVAVTVPVGEQHRIFVEWAGFLGAHSDQAKFLARYGFESKIAELQWSIFGSFRAIGNEKDFGTAFEYSESWGVGLFVRMEFPLW